MSARTRPDFLAAAGSTALLVGADGIAGRAPFSAPFSYPSGGRVTGEG